MFDDQPAGSSGQVPPNLPLGEPEDMFAGADIGADRSPDTTGAPDEPSALEAGILRPAQPSYQVMPREFDERNTMSQSVMNEPVPARRGLTGLIMIVVLLILGGGGAWAYVKFVRGGGDKIEPALEVQETTPSKPIPQPVPSSANQASPSATVDDKILFGEPVDTDGDGLDDVREADLRTDPLNWDTDGDQLGDGDEVVSWKSDPLNPDTDKDTLLR